MKKILYIIGVLCLFLLIAITIKTNLSEEKTSSMEFVPTANFLSQVQAENKNEKKIAYMTFDDGPSEITPLILDTLKEKGIKATFFLIGNEMTPEREEIIYRIIDEGHVIGVHTQSHKKNDLYSSFDNFFKDFEAAQSKIEEVTGKEVKLHRYPWGSANNFLAPLFRSITAELQERGIKSFDWNATGEDSLNDGICGAQIKANIAKTYGRYVDPIILLHDGNTNKNTALILGDVIDMIREDGYAFDTLDHRDAFLFPEEWR